MRDYKGLTDHLGYFETLSNGFYTLHTTGPAGYGQKENEILTFPYAEYPKEIDDFFKAFEPFTDHDYSRTLKRYGVNYDDVTTDFSKADAGLIFAIITAVIRAERFGNEGKFGEMAKQGVIFKMLNRLKELDKK